MRSSPLRRGRRRTGGGVPQRDDREGDGEATVVALELRRSQRNVHALRAMRDAAAIPPELPPTCTRAVSEMHCPRSPVARRDADRTSHRTHRCQAAIGEPLDLRGENDLFSTPRPTNESLPPPADRQADRTPNAHRRLTP
jgi:hypothetical protein